MNRVKKTQGKRRVPIWSKNIFPLYKYSREISCLNQALSSFLYQLSKIFKDSQVYEQVTKKFLSLKAKNYSLRCNSKTSLRKPERCQRSLLGDVFNQSSRRRLRDFQISPLYELSLRRHKDASETHQCRLGSSSFNFRNIFIQNFSCTSSGSQILSKLTENS